MKSAEAKDRVKEAADEAARSGKVDKTKGYAKEVVGSVKARFGSVIGSEKLEAEGHLQNAEGRKDRMKGEIKETIEDLKDKAKAGVEIVRDKIHDIRKG
jgi:uncharacterized protein YjbJ (UPF0337 family)